MLHNTLLNVYENTGKISLWSFQNEILVIGHNFGGERREGDCVSSSIPNYCDQTFDQSNLKST